MEWLARQRMLIGTEATERLARAHVAVFGLGGVGGHAAEALARCGVGKMTLVDGDIVSPTNLNRQLIATEDTLGMPKAEVMGARLKSINPALHLSALKLFFMPGMEDAVDFSALDYIVDAVDTVPAKVHLAVLADRHGVPIISAMGAGNKLDPSRFEVTDISQTSVCPLCRVMRRELKRAGVHSLRVVYSREKPREVRPGEGMASPEADTALIKKRNPPGSVSFVPPVVGMILAGEVVRSLAGLND